MLNTKDLLVESFKWYEKDFQLKILKSSEIVTPSLIILTIEYHSL